MELFGMFVLGNESLYRMNTRKSYFMVHYLYSKELFCTLKFVFLCQLKFRIKIMDKNTLEFVTFAIGSVAERVCKSPAEIYNLLKRTHVIEGYLIPAYDVLHTFGRQYLVDDILGLLNDKGVKLC